MNENLKLAYETIMEKSPFMRSILENKIAEEVGKKQQEIDQLKAELEVARNDGFIAMLALTEVYEMILMMQGGM